MKAKEKSHKPAWVQAFSKFSQVELELKYSLNPENLFESTCLSLIEFATQQPNIYALDADDKYNKSAQTENVYKLDIIPEIIKIL